MNNKTMATSQTITSIEYKQIKKISENNFHIYNIYVLTLRNIILYFVKIIY